MVLDSSPNMKWYWFSDNNLITRSFVNIIYSQSVRYGNRSTRLTAYRQRIRGKDFFAQRRPANGFQRIHLPGNVVGRLGDREALFSSGTHLSKRQDDWMLYSAAGIQLEKSYPIAYSWMLTADRWHRPFGNACFQMGVSSYLQPGGSRCRSNPEWSFYGKHLRRRPWPCPTTGEKHILRRRGILSDLHICRFPLCKVILPGVRIHFPP